MPKFDPSKELPAEKAQELIKGIINNGFLILTPHVRQRMADRNFTDMDIIHVGTEYDELHKNWKYKVSGQDIEGESGFIITALKV